MEIKGKKVYTEMPKGWRVRKGSPTAPKGYVWIYNSKSIFSKEYQQAFLLVDKTLIKE